MDRTHSNSAGGLTHKYTRAPALTIVGARLNRRGQNENFENIQLRNPKL